MQNKNLVRKSQKLGIYEQKMHFSSLILFLHKSIR